MTGPKTGYEIGKAKAWATGHLVAAIAITAAVAFVLGVWLG